jgi:hypothetical protein
MGSFRTTQLKIVVQSLELEVARLTAANKDLQQKLDAAQSPPEQSVIDDLKAQKEQLLVAQSRLNEKLRDRDRELRAMKSTVAQESTEALTRQITDLSRNFIELRDENRKLTQQIGALGEFQGKKEKLELEAEGEDKGKIIRELRGRVASYEYRFQKWSEFKDRNSKNSKPQFKNSLFKGI